MDEAYRKHHMWVKPKLELLPERLLPAPGLRQLPGGQARASTSPATTTWSTTSCGPTTSRTTRARGRTRPRRSSGPWATSTTPSGPRSSGSTAPGSSSCPIPERYLDHADAADVAAGGRSVTRERAHAAGQGRGGRRRRDDLLQVGPVARSRIQAGHRGRAEGVRERRHRPDATSTASPPTATTAATRPGCRPPSAASS